MSGDRYEIVVRNDGAFVITNLNRHRFLVDENCVDIRSCVIRQQSRDIESLRAELATAVAERDAALTEIERLNAWFEDEITESPLSNVVLRQRAEQAEARLAAIDAALAAERERICAAIKATDDAASTHDYMLDSDDCIAVVRGELGPSNYPDVPAQAGNGGEG